MTTLLKGLGKLQVSSNPVSDSPTDEDFIRFLDYEELERKFGCDKYYPKFLNNYDYSTPEIKEMIGNKPVYSKANKHLKNFKNPGTKKTFVTEIDVETGELTVKEKIEKEDKKDRKQRKEERKARREGRKEDRKERKELRREQRDERKELRLEQLRKRREQANRNRKDEGKSDQGEVGAQVNGHVQLESSIQPAPQGDAAPPPYQERRSSVATGHSGSTQNSGPFGAPLKAADNPTQNKGPGVEDNDFSFNNPFGEQSTLVPEKIPENKPTHISRHDSVASKYSGIRARQGSVHSGVKPRQNSVQTLEKPRKFTLSSRLRDMLMPHKHTACENNTELQRTQSFDQTRSTMTSNRGAKTGKLKISINDSKARRMSEQIGTYNLILKEENEKARMLTILMMAELNREAGAWSRRGERHATE
ncbi:hypothetical protein CJJ07_002609 [Candidozyma auris]|nr:hypothetical protein CJJ07_002609 [[Candida] auris]QEL58337.1 hypothetical protein CJJ09_000373 [[Candida] auris]